MYGRTAIRARPTQDVRTRYYPLRKSRLEILLDQFFMAEDLGRFQRDAEKSGVFVELETSTYDLGVNRDSYTLDARFKEDIGAD